MRRYLRLLLCLPLFATTACAADIAGPRLAPAPQADPAAQAAPNTTYQGCIVPPERANRETLYIVDGVPLSTLPDLDANDIESVEVQTNRSEFHGPRVTDVIIITTRTAAGPRSGARP